MNFRLLKIVSIIALITLPGCTSTYQIKPQTSDTLVLDSLQTIKKIRSGGKFRSFEYLLKDSVGCAIFPSLYKAGFVLGAEGGNGLVIARDSKGNWGYPAFYTLAAGSWGFQIGAQKAGVVFIIRNKGALKAIIEHQGKLGVEIVAAAGPVGSGLEGSTTTTLAADIYAFSDTKGLFAGVSLKGAGLIRRNDLNQEYYGKKVAPSSILLENAHLNSQANQLRNYLSSH